MSLSPVKKEIDGMDVYSTPFPVLKQGALMAKLLRLFTPVMGLAGKDIAVIMKMKTAELQPMLAKLFTAIDEADFEKLAVEVLRTTSVTVTGEDGKPRLIELSDATNIERALAGKLPTLLRCIYYALEVNFKNFFPAALGGASAAPKVASD